MASGCLLRLACLSASLCLSQTLVSAANQSQLQHALCLETAASVRSNLSDAMWPGLEQCFAISSPQSQLQQALCLETAASMVSNLSDMMLSYPGMECEMLYPLSRANSARSAPAPTEGQDARRAVAQGRSEKAPAPGADASKTGQCICSPTLCSVLCPPCMQARLALGITCICAMLACILQARSFACIDLEQAITFRKPLACCRCKARSTSHYGEHCQTPNLTLWLSCICMCC